ncbi:MAG TPA: VOC family protein [Acidimicrobiia bacterium]|jgi:methylmalonyl-CoA/ethylmalonyl-CoA epimerase|nr:VOC family protein [Acidimicrobiia bacterium]
MAEMKLAHIGYVVRNIERSVERFEKEGATLLIAAAPDPVQGVYVALLRIEDEVDIELVSPIVVGESPVDSRLSRGGGLDHLCYFVADVQSALEAEQSNGGIVVCHPTFACVFEREIGFVQRRSGLVVEFMSDVKVLNGD